MLETKFNSKHTVLRNLLKIRGIGPTKAREICESVGISIFTIQEELSPARADRLSQTLVNIKKFTKPGPLRVPLGASEAQKAPLGHGAPTSRHPLSGVGPLSESAVRGFSLPKNPSSSPRLFLIDMNLDLQVKESILRLVNVDCYRGRRRGASKKTGNLLYAAAYPVRGQRTRSNAKTAKKLNSLTRGAAAP
jgi:ribosomal protein S13